MTTVQHGRTSFSSATTGTVTFAVPFLNTPTVVVTLQQSNTTYLFAITVTTVSTTGFTWRQYGATVANPSQVFNAGDAMTLHWVAYN